MAEVRKFIFPAILLASVCVFLLTRWLTGPERIVQAAADNSAAVEPPVEAIPPPEEGATVEQSSGCGIPASYPEDIRQWCEPITQVSAYYGIDPALVAAVMLQESGGNPDAYSKSGAVGLLQVMPRDGLAADFLCANGPCFSARPTMDELFDPRFNIDFGVKLLTGLIAKFGDIREGLRAYGPMDSGYHYADLILTIYNRYQ